jgi:hypothetical protein
VAVDAPPLATSKVKSDTTCATAELVADKKFESPGYAAVSECVPAVRLDVEYVAVREANVPEPSRVVPS